MKDAAVQDAAEEVEPLVTVPDITRKHWAVNIRKFTRHIRDLNQLVGLGSLTQQAAEFLRICGLAGQNILVSGATQTGKTTMLNALLCSTRQNERIVTVEETFELDLTARDVVAMQCRQPSLEGTGEITLRRLIKESLRMRPDRLVVGEVREAESLDLLIALNSGLLGMCSIHANSARAAMYARFGAANIGLIPWGATTRSRRDLVLADKPTGEIAPLDVRHDVNLGGPAQQSRKPRAAALDA